jgi:transglutaminase-like putative cysteine protease
MATLARVRDGRLASSVSFITATFLVAGISFAQDENGARLGKAVTQCWQIGLTVKAAGPCSGVYATTPLPVDWPEQTVKVVSEEIVPASAKVTYRTLEGGVKQLLLRVPRLAAGEEARALIMFDVTKHELEAPEETSNLVIPARPGKETARYLTPSPFIESQHAKIKALAKEVLAERKDAPAWKQVEALYDAVRAKVEYKHDDRIKGALVALQDGVGDCEELSSLFVAVCRASKIPARCVWVNSHTYPEFYLQDENGVGRWYPCQAAGDREFGGIRDQQPILQKGDSFKVPEFKQPQRYVQVYCKVDDVRGGQPQVSEVRRPVAK